MNISKTEKLMIEKLKTLPDLELSRLIFNAIGVDEQNLNLLEEAIPTASYQLPTREFRRHFEMLEHICFICGLQFWRDYALFQEKLITPAQMSATCLALNDVIEHFQIDSQKAKVMGMDAFYTALAEQQNSTEIHCPETRKVIFNGIKEGSERLIK